MRLTVNAAAKLNLFLDIAGKRSDGYHIINTVMQSVSLYDEVTVITDNSDDIKIQCTDFQIPCDETNTAYKAVTEFFHYTGITPSGITVKIKKRIPSQAGMAGGSTDAAAVLTAMNEIFDTRLNKSQLAEIAEKIGADVPFCLYGGTMAAGGIGTILTPLPDIPECYFVTVKPDFRISTKEAYEKSDTIPRKSVKNIDLTVDSICNGSIHGIGKAMYNRFEEVIDIPEIDEIKNIMTSHGAAGACLTGSGSVVYGLFENKDDADQCVKALEDIYDNVYLLRPVQTEN